MRAAFLALGLLLVASVAHAADGEELATPSFRRPGLIQFKVKPGDVASISVELTTVAKDGRRDAQIFELTPNGAVGTFPDGSGMWESNKPEAAWSQWAGNPGNVDHMELAYVVHAVDAAGQRRAVESRDVYTFAGAGERGFASSTFPVARRNPGRGLARVDAADVQASVDRLAQRAPTARWVALPGAHPHPLHAENDLVRAIRKVTAQKRADPRGDYFVRFSLYIHDSIPLTEALLDAKAAGVDVEGLTDWKESTPRLASRPALDRLRAAGIPLRSMVRGLANDIRTNHSKIWIMGQRDAGGRITDGTTFDCSFNTEFSNYPANQEGMTVFKRNRDVATVYHHMYEAMKGNAPLRLVIDPAKARFVVTHPLYPYVDAKGQVFGARELFHTFLGKARRSLTMLDYVHADPGLAHATGAVARRARVDVFLNGWKVHHDGGAGGAHQLRGEGANVHAVHHRSGGGSPLHHKSGVADATWVRGGSLNPGWWSFDSDETMHLIRSPYLARQVLATANRVAHDYAIEEWGGSSGYPYATENVQVEVRVPAGIDPKDIDKVYFGGGGSHALGSSWMELGAAGTRGTKTIFRGSRRLPLGFAHEGRPGIRLKDGSMIWSTAPATFFRVEPRTAGRQRIAVGFRK